VTPREKKLRWEHYAAALFLGAMALIAFLNILGRYLFHYSLAFTEEVTINLFVCLVMVGSGLAFERGGQLGMVSLFNIFPITWKKRLVFLGAFLGAALFLTVDILLIQAIYYEVTVFKATSPALGIPVWIYYAPLPLLSISVFRGIYRGAVLLSRQERCPDL
jgi:TRAP-type C4-dicarboxylate transport system permease small subunit